MPDNRPDRGQPGDRVDRGRLSKALKIAFIAARTDIDAGRNDRGLLMTLAIARRIAERREEEETPVDPDAPMEE